MEAVQDLRHINNRAYVHAVVAAARLLGVRHLRQHVTRRTSGELLHHALAATVVEHQAVGVLHQARGLLLRRLIEALLIDFDVEASRQKFRLVFGCFGITIIDRLHAGQVGIEPGSIEAGLVQVLRGANKSARTSAHSIAEGGKVAAGFRSEK